MDAPLSGWKGGSEGVSLGPSFYRGEKKDTQSGTRTCSRSHSRSASETRPECRVGLLSVAQSYHQCLNKKEQAELVRKGEGKLDMRL